MLRHLLLKHRLTSCLACFILCVDDELQTGQQDAASAAQNVCNNLMAAGVFENPSIYRHLPLMLYRALKNVVAA